MIVTTEIRDVLNDIGEPAKQLVLSYINKEGNTMISYTSRVETYTNFGEDIKRNCEHLIKLAEQVDLVLNTYSTDVQDIDAQNQALLYRVSLRVYYICKHFHFLLYATRIHHQIHRPA